MVAPISYSIASPVQAISTMNTPNMLVRSSSDAVLTFVLDLLVSTEQFTAGDHHLKGDYRFLWSTELNMKLKLLIQTHILKLKAFFLFSNYLIMPKCLHLTFISVINFMLI